ncbi:protein phosphatase 1 regulatory subunit 3A [Fukomys damarensis]|uniref:Protein phosphatase 1 regulatory subunit 3A n=1 Tax=Fukomys damarensis TaxID=885580 RepID=A0A091DVG9_FUKDA|nr:protein phosphatase 1 regulatory subunit 3A [Fukomys damarensis]KFO34265.1 Protein phosphatase 1 regulatory subunit 3A [Fukomys damarensis]
MEPAEVPSQISKDNFLEVPNVSDSACEEEVKTAFKPGFSPQPSRRSSASSEDMYLGTPTSGSRRVSFADSFGFNLVSIKEFDSWELPSISTDFELRKDIFHTEECILSPLFDLPSSKEDLMQQLQVRKAILESTEYPPGSTSMKGIIRVLNVSFEKLVYVRMSLDDWQTYYDILAQYVPDSCDGETDQFSFKISLVPPYQKDGSKIEFCIRYETSMGTFWSNNNGANYILLCQKKEQRSVPEKPQEEVSSRQKKGCLKVKSSKEESSITSEENNFRESKFTDTGTPTIICSHEDKEDLESSNQNVKDVNREHDEHNEKELDLMIHQHLIRTRSAAPRDEKDTFSSDPVNFHNKAKGLEKKKVHGKLCTDLFERSLSPNSSAESSLKGDFFHNEKYSSRYECSHQLSEEITSEMKEIKTSLEDTSSNELVQLHIGRLEDNADPAHRSGRVKTSCSSPDQRMAGDRNKNHEGGAKKSEIKDWECLSKDFHSGLGAYTERSTDSEDYGKVKDEKEQRVHLGVKKQSRLFQSLLNDHERKLSQSEISVEGTESREKDLAALSSKGTTIPAHAVTEVTFPSSRINLNWEETTLMTSESDHSAGEGTTSEGIDSKVCLSRKRNVLRDDYLFQAEEKADWINPEDRGRNTQHTQNWNILESQEKVKGSQTNIKEQIKEQADCEDVLGERDNTSLNVTPTEELFTCQETECDELYCLADHGVTEKAQAGTAYIIKTPSESTPESMSAREKAIIAKRSQETARSDRPIEVKETAFDPHEEGNDDVLYTLCQRDTAGVIYDNEFEKESHVDICNVRADEIEKEEAMHMYNPGKMHDREKHGAGNIYAEESSQRITSNQKETSNLDLHSEVSSTDKRIFAENRDLQQVQNLSKKTDLEVANRSASNSDKNRASHLGSRVSSQHPETSVPSYEEAKENTISTKSISTESEDNCDPSGIQGHLGSKPKEVCTSAESSSGRRKERCMGQIFQPGEYSVGKSIGPTILISEPLENTEEARHDNEGSLSSGQCSSDDKASENYASASFPVHKSEAQSSESLLSKYANSKIPYFLLFLVFLVTIYQYDLTIGLAFYLFSLYWLYREAGRQKESVKKK